MTAASLSMPSDVLPVIDAYRTCEFLTVSKSGVPIAWPTVSAYGTDGTFTLTTSIGLPQKAFNVRRNPQVAVLFSDPTGSGLQDTPQVLIQGTAVCPDEVVTSVLRAREVWSRIFERQPESRAYSANPVSRWMMDFYYMRLLITITPTAVTRRRAVAAPGPLAGDQGPARVEPDADDAYGQAARRLPEFRSAVLAGFDQNGHPTMTRVRPVVDPRNRSLLITVPEGFSVCAGKASLLCHSHDEELASLHGFVVAGELTGEGDSWTVHPSRYIPAADPKGPLSMVKTIRALRGTARRYLDRRGLTRPRIAWEDIETVKAEALAAAHREP
ncbi:pyridoxamine 5'-phosphate oxidase family protein [Nakamurella sp. GG22]